LHFTSSFLDITLSAAGPSASRAAVPLLHISMNALKQTARINRSALKPVNLDNKMGAVAAQLHDNNFPARPSSPPGPCNYAAVFDRQRQERPPNTIALLFLADEQIGCS